MKKIIITGAKGKIGTVLSKGLQGYSITLLDLPEGDARDYQQLLHVFPGHDAVIHLAWDTKIDNWKTGKISPDNTLMTYNVYRAAMECKVPRVIMASSNHADGYFNWKGPGLMKPEKTPFPDSPYGANKVFMEALGRYYTKHHGLEVVCVRFGGVNLEDRPDSKEISSSKVWLSHRDCVSLIGKCIEAKKIPENFCIIYGISNNSDRVHDWQNPLGWVPEDKA